MDAEQFEATLKEAETKLRRVRALYDQWFAGIERLEPQTQRDDLMRVLARLKAMPPRNTGLRFRLNQLSQQFTTYQTYWKRITRQIEEGTYQRDVLRARRQRDDIRTSARTASETEPESARPLDAGPQTLDLDVQVEPGSLPPPGASTGPGVSIPPLPTFRPASINPLAQPDAVEAPHPASVRPPPLASGATRSRPRPSSRPPATGADGVPDAHMRALYDRYVRARQSNAERTDNVTYERLAQQVNDLLPKLKAKHPGKKVGFTVVVRDGKVALKPVTK